MRRRTLTQLAGVSLCAPWTLSAAAPRRVLHVMSFDSPWRWTDGQWAGFLDGLADPAVQTLVFQLDVKRHRSAAAKAERGRLALEAVRQWGPDLVYLSDDDAVEQVARPLAGSGLPLVFSGVNRSLQDHGLVGAPNVTGVLEREHVAETLRLLQVLVPAARRLAVVSDGASYWDRVIERVRVRAGQRPDMTLARVDRVASLADYQQRLRECEREVDAVLHLGILTLTGSDGATVPYQQVQRWVAEHVQLPDASFWSDRVHHGTLVAMAVSEVEQGRAAGRLARAILHDGQAPASLPVQATTKGRPVLCLPRAMRLGLRPSSSLLLSAEVVRRYAWEGA
jgi:ABC-type uncharacterized transport system substrate-binding protein